VVTVSEAYPVTSEGTLDIERWLSRIRLSRDEQQTRIICHAIELAMEFGGDHQVPEGENVLEHGLAMAEILAHLNMDTATLAAAIAFPAVEYGDLSLDKVRHQLGKEIARLIAGVRRMQALRALQERQANTALSQEEIEQLRKMLLAMVDDTRVVMIKLARRLQMMRLSRHLPADVSRQIAQETMDIYAPLANRLGVGQLKWELEDLAFRELHPQDYKTIARKLDARRIDRERYINQVIETLQSELNRHGIKADIAGRAKHIYSIWRKMKRKGVGFEEIYDARAIRVLVNSVSECYAVLGIVHGLWPHIPKEFDDYIATPKANGYRSIHTAVIGPEQKALEVQIRTFDMHRESEHGVAAHWRYKEGRSASGDEAAEKKVAWLRQLLLWQKDVATTDELVEQFVQSVEEDRIYVFTPEGRVIDLPPGATPLDFAYHVHTEIGHRCVGARVDGKMAPLTMPLETGQTVEVLTRKDARPSRDWLRADAGYLRSQRARQKVAQWFRRQSRERHVGEGREMLQKALGRVRPQDHLWRKIAEHFNVRQFDDLAAAVGSGDVGLESVLKLHERLSREQAGKASSPASADDQRQESGEQPSARTFQGHGKPSSQVPVEADGVGALMCHLARCCGPVPGDPIVGYVTQGRGVSIHHEFCPHLRRLQQEKPERLLSVHWRAQPDARFRVNLELDILDRPGLLKDVTHLLAQKKIPVLAMQTHVSRRHEEAWMDLTVEVRDQSQLEDLCRQLEALADVRTVRRREAKGGSHGR
jgi:GTP pyrophosphokinase